MSGGSAHILVVDDTPSSVRLLQGLLEGEGYRTTTAGSGEEALATIRSGEPDLVLLDLFLPGMGGAEVCRLLRLDALTRALPVIVLTAAGSQERLAVLEAGADDFLNKPVDRAELLARVRSLLRIKRYQQEIQALNADLENRVSEQVDQLARLSRLRRFLPATVAELVTSADEEWLLDTHRAKVAVVCCELRGFTAFAHVAAPEQVVEVLRSFHRAAGEQVAATGGTLGGLSGDRMMAFLNDPLPCADPAQRALELAQAWHGVADNVLRPWREEGYQLGLGVGVALGHATMAVLAAGERVEYVPIGSVANLASRLCDRAAEGEVLLSQSVRAAIGDLDDGVQTEGLDLAGFPGPVTAWRIGGSSELAPAGPLTIQPLHAPVVESPYVFRQEGDDWTLAYKGKAARARDSKGMAFIGKLLATPGKELHVADLAGITIPVGTDTGPVIDEKAKQAYRQRLVDLEAEREEARDWGDLERVVRLEEEIDFLTAELSSAFGLAGRARRSGDPTDRIRKAVTNRIRHALARLSDLHPELGRHLSNSIRTGTFCSYQPESPVDWVL